MIGYERITFRLMLLGGNMTCLSLWTYVIIISELFVGNILLCDDRITWWLWFSPVMIV